MKNLRRDFLLSLFSFSGIFFYCRHMPIWNELKSLIVPIQCIRCSLSDVIICAECKKYFLESPENRPRFLSTKIGEPAIASHLPFSSDVSRLILGAKDSGNKILESVLLNSLLQTRNLFPSKLILVPIPSRKKARLMRGRDFLFEMCKTIARISGDEVVPFLAIARQVSAQKSLNANERLQNMRGAFEIRRDLLYSFHDSFELRKILIVDDVLTTGATMREGFRALGAGGARCIGGISAAYSLNWSMSRLAH